MASSQAIMSSSRNMSVRTHRRRLSNTARARRTSSCDVRSPRSTFCEQAYPPLLSSSAPKLAKLRAAVLDHLKDLEKHLSQLETPLRQMRDENQDRGESQLRIPVQDESSGNMSTIHEARVRINDGLEMLDRIRSDVCSHLPDFPGLDFLPDISLDDMRSHIPSFDFSDIDIHLPRTPFTSSLDDVSFSLDKLQYPLSYLPKLTHHLESLHEHILSVKLPSPLSLHFTMPSPSRRISELISKLQDPDLFTDPLKGPFDFFGDSRKPFEWDDKRFVENKSVLWEHQTLHGLFVSNYGTRLVSYQDLPERYKNDEYVLTGYRFIPLYRWPLLVLSIFRLHNETSNIWSHLLPLAFSLTTLASTPFSQSGDSAERVFALFSNICLASSCVWHVMYGCSNLNAMETAARVDYVGIGWLISASIGSIMYYGFCCRPHTAALYLSVSLALGVIGSILPFMAFFNERQNKKWRIMFFLSLVLTLIIPLAHLAVVHSLWDMFTFMRPEVPSLTAYTIGLVFYTFQFPQCVTPVRWKKCTDFFGGGSHTIWHLFIVLAIKFHKDAMIEYRRGIGGEVCTLSFSGRTS